MLDLLRGVHLNRVLILLLDVSFLNGIVSYWEGGCRFSLMLPEQKVLIIGFAILVLLTNLTLH